MAEDGSSEKTKISFSFPAEDFPGSRGEHIQPNASDHFDRFDMSSRRSIEDPRPLRLPVEETMSINICPPEKPKKDFELDTDTILTLLSYGEVAAKLHELVLDSPPKISEALGRINKISDSIKIWETYKKRQADVINSFRGKGGFAAQGTDELLFAVPAGIIAMSGAAVEVLFWQNPLVEQAISYGCYTYNRHSDPAYRQKFWDQYQMRHGYPRLSRPARSKRGATVRSAP